MGLLGVHLVIQRMLTVSIYRTIRFLFTVVQRVYWQLNGTARQLREAKLPENYDRCAQVLDVHFFHKFCQLQNLDEVDFLCTHNRFESPQFIFDNDHVTLMTINDEYAIFSEAPEKGMHVWKSEFSSFIRWAQMSYTRRMIRVPMNAFHRMAETLGDPKHEIIFLLNAVRCGSTLFTQVMEYTGCCVSISEPDAPNLVAVKYNKYGDTPEVRQLARDVIRWQCRPYHTLAREPLAYVIKLTSPSVVSLPLLRKVFPNNKCLFMYRDTLTIAKSLYRLAYPLPSLTLAYLLGPIHEDLLEKVIDSMGYSGKMFRFKLGNDLSLGTLTAGLGYQFYFKIRAVDKSVRALRYEDLIKNPLEICRAILEFCGLPVSLAESAARGLEADSQRNSPLSKKIIGGIREPVVTPEMKRSLNEMLAKMQLPNIDELNYLDGTLVAEGA